jgi:hypothetical protein
VSRGIKGYNPLAPFFKENKIPLLFTREGAACLPQAGGMSLASRMANVEQGILNVEPRPKTFAVCPLPLAVSH